jgi:1-acyl-sn-glycerol-3-phosphate acyltransferase
LDKRKVIYYTDELNDEFSSAEITPRFIGDDYVYEKKGALYSLYRFFLYRAVAAPLAFLYVKLSLHQKTVGREKLRAFRKSGIFLYGNHTQQIGDPLTPNVFCFPKRVSFVVHPNNVSMPVLGRLTPDLGAIPLPDTLEARRNFTSCVETRIKEGEAVVIYPEAHIWPYYTKIRPFTDDSFIFPAKSGAPVFCFTNVYRRRRIGRKPKMITYIDGPFHPDLSLAPRQRRRALRDAVYGAMCERAKLSDAEVIRYGRREANDENDVNAPEE